MSDNGATGKALVTCDYCGKEFTADRHRIETTQNLYCCPKHHQAAERKKRHSKGKVEEVPRPRHLNCEDGIDVVVRDESRYRNCPCCRRPLRFFPGCSAVRCECKGLIHYEKGIIEAN